MRPTLPRIAGLFASCALTLFLATNSFALTNGLSIGISFAADEPNGGGSALAPTDVTGAFPQANWNNVTGATGNSSALVKDTKGVGAPTTATVTWSCPNTWSSTGRGEENNQLPAGPDHQLMVGYLDTDNAAGVVTISVGNLPAEFTQGTYDVVVYALGGTSAARWGAYSIGSVTQILNSAANPTGFVLDPGLNPTDAGNYAVFKNIRGSSFTLVANAVTAFGNGFRAPVNAIQIVSHGSLPNALNIGGNKIGSVTDEGGGSYTIVGGGNDIWDAVDEFTYAYTEVEGDFDVQVRVESLTANAQWSKAGIMVRESLSEFSRMVFPRVTPDQPPGVNDVHLAYRNGTDKGTDANGNPIEGVSGGQHEDGGGNPSGIPNAWLRLVRQGAVFNAFTSSDGATWNPLSSQDTATWGAGAMASHLYVGLGVSRHSGGPTATAVFRSFQFNSNAAPFGVVSANSRGNPTGVRVDFDNPVGAGAYDPANYSLSVVSGPNVSVVTGLRITTANDAPGRDPLTYTLEGSPNNGTGPWTLIASGSTGLDTDPGRNTAGPIVTFANTTAYRSYRLLFPTVRNMVYSGTDNSMQISEFELLDGANADVTQPGDPVVGIQAVAGSLSSSIAIAGTAQNGFNDYPAAEAPPNALDNNPATKYLNFAKTNAGVIVVPSGGVAATAPTVLSAVSGQNANSVQLTTTPLIEGVTYQLTVANVLGADSSPLNNTTATFVHGAGYEPRKILVMHNKTSDSGYYRNSDAVAKGIGDVVHTGGGVFPPYQTNGVFEDPIPDSPSIERFGTRISGVLIAPASGNYVFACSSDDVGFLYLSSDANPANKVQIATEPAWNGPRQYITGDNQASRGSPPANISAPQTLVAGKQYYIEYVYNEGGGGNNGSATWQPPGGAAIANGSSPIPDSAFVPTRMYRGNSFRTLGPVQIVSQPASQSVTALLPVTFRVGLDGTPGYTYQWRRNGQPIPGANGPTYTIAAAQPADDQAAYSVVVANEFSSATSANAILTVLTPTPPHALSAANDLTFTRVHVTFDNRLDLATSQEPGNYTISGGVSVLSATRDSTAKGVDLTTTPLATDTTYTLTISDIHDETGTTTIESNPTNLVFTTLAFANGFVKKEYYLGWTAGGGSVDAFITAYRNKTTPLSSDCLTNIWEFNTADQFDNYGGHMYGYFVPPVDGNYTFYFSSDDYGRLFLSTDANPANVREIAREPVWAGRREWVGAGGGGGRGGASASGGPQQNISGPITLVGGQKYYMESFFTEGGGGDNMGVTVKIPVAGDPIYSVDPVNGGPGIPASMLGVYVQAGALAINTQPQSQTRDVNGFASFTVGASGSSPLCGGGTINYQWFSNGVAVAGANSPSLIVGPLDLSANGAVFTASVSSPGRSLITSNAVLTVIEDTNRPVLVSARADNTFRTIFLNWNELMSEGPAIDPSAYQLYDPAQNQILIDSVTFTGSNVVLHLQQAMQENVVYSLEIDFQTDLAGNPTLKVGDPQVDIDNGVVTSVRSFVISRGFARFDAFLGLTVPNNNDVSPIINSPNYPNNPSFFFFSNQVNWPQTVPDVNNYGMRWTFYFTAPADGTYKFEPAHDDAARIYAATDGNPANKVMVFDEVCCNGFSAAEAGYTVDLTAGQTIFIELIVIEAGGGDYAGLSVTLPNGQYIAPITSQFIASAIDPIIGSTNNVGIAQQPQSVTIQENHAATFSVVVTNPGPYGAAYQWQVDTGSGFTDIGGAVSATYTTPYLTLADSGHQYRVKVFVLGKTLTSDAATVTVGLDTTKPVVSRAAGGRFLNAIIVTYSEAMDPGSAGEVGNYTLTDSGNNPVNLGIPVLSADAKTVTIPTDPQTAGGTYHLQVQDVADVAGNAIDPTNLTFQVWTIGPAFLNFETYTGGGNAVADLTSLPTYPASPDLIAHIAGADSRLIFPTDAREGYGARISGYFTPQVTTNYTFYLRSDDASELWLSTDANPANKALLTAETACCNAFSAHASASTPLVAGQPYYIELLYKEGTGGDFGQAAVKMTGDPTDPNTLQPINWSFLSSLADPVGASITITQQPANQVFIASTGSGNNLLNNDFSSDNGGFTVTSPNATDGPWTYDSAAGVWHEDGQAAENGHPNTTLLSSPTLTVGAAGHVLLSFTHRYSFEYDGTAWDGGQVRVSVNGGAYVTVPNSAFTQNGYGGGQVAPGSSSDLHGQPAFISTSPGYASASITSIADLGAFNPGDTVSVQFMAASDTNTRGTVPNWEITSVQVSQGNAAAAVTFTVGSARVTSESGSNPPTVYQWYHDSGAGFVRIPGANSASYTFVPQALDSGTQYRVDIYIPGAQTTSASATLTVASPGRLSIAKSGGQVTVSWTGSYCLEETSELGPSAVWTPSSVANSVPFTPGAGNKFYRLNACP